ncbi:MAG: hypothetical protein AAGK32_08505, partial [Actinomycetota bacterium]
MPGTSRPAARLRSPATVVAAVVALAGLVAVDPVAAHDLTTPVWTLGGESGSVEGCEARADDEGPGVLLFGDSHAINLLGPGKGAVVV